MSDKLDVKSTLDIVKILYNQAKFLDVIDKCNHILANDSKSIEALKFIAKSLLQLKRVDESRMHLFKLLDINPLDYETIKDLGNSYLAVNDIESAKSFYEQALKIQSNYSPALTNLGIIEFSSGHINKGLVLMVKATKADPSFETSWINLINAHRQLNNLDEAICTSENALQTNYSFCQINFILATIFIDKKLLNKAKNILLNIVEDNPDFHEAYLKLADIMHSQSLFIEAEKVLRRALKIEPNFPSTYCNLGLMLRYQGSFSKAEDMFNKAIEIDPSFRTSYAYLGDTLRRQNKFLDAEIVMRKYIELDPTDSSAYYELGNLFKQCNAYEEARDNYIKALKYNPNDLSFNIHARLSLPVLYSNNQHIDQCRDDYMHQIKLLAKNKKLIFRDNSCFSTDLFYLAYHNRENDRLILEELANTLSQVDGIVNKSFNRDKQINSYKNRESITLGICTEYFYKHSVAFCFGNVIKDLSQAGIQIILFTASSSPEDSISQSITSALTETVVLPKSLQEGCELIISKSLDILLFLDNGMSHYNYLLSLSRLALVQVALQGHPNTTGSPNIDYFISSSYLETKDSDKFYTETLIRFNRNPCNIPFPTINSNSNFSRSELNLSDDIFLIGIPHTTFKFHPDFDLVLDSILYEIPNAIFFCAESKFQTDKLMTRWKSKSKLLIERTIFYPRTDLNKFLQILKSFDIVLDPFYFGMGSTFNQSMAFGIPVVTMPSNQARGRTALAGYNCIGIKNPPVASSPAEYVSICKKLALDKSYRDFISKQILSLAKNKLFNDTAIYNSYIEFFDYAIDAAINNTYLSKDWRPKSI